MRNIPFGMPIIGEEERKAVDTVLRGPILVHGPKAKEFELEFSKFVGGGESTSVSSATAALHLSYFYLGLGAGDEVIVPAQTHTATAHAVELTGAKPIFVDCEGETGNIDIDQIENAISSKTKAISIVHFLGMPVNMDRLTALAKRKGLFVVEDCALAMGTLYKGKHAGLFGDVGCFSFYPVKHMTTSEGGMLIANDSDIVKKITRQKAFGVDRTPSERAAPGIYDVNMLGFNYRMSEIEAVIGIEQLKRMPGFLESRKRNYFQLEAGLKELPEIELLRSSHGDFESSYYCLSMILSTKIRERRFEFVKFLNEKGIGTSVYYPKPVPHMSYYKNKYGISLNTFPEASRISYGSVALPVAPHISEDDITYIISVVKEGLLKI